VVVAQPSAAKAPASTAPIQKITAAAFTAGALTCAKRINDVSNYVSGTASNDFILFSPPTDPDQHSLSASLELAGVGQEAYVSATFSPNPIDCDVAYDAVMWWPASCEGVARTNFAALKPQSILHKKIRVLDGGANMKVFLMPAGSGCVSIKKEIIR
jgi:hypothetical protein